MEGLHASRGAVSRTQQPCHPPKPRVNPYLALCTSLPPTQFWPGYSDLQPSVSRIAVDLLSCQLACETAGEQGAQGAVELDPAGWGGAPVTAVAA